MHARFLFPVLLALVLCGSQNLTAAFAAQGENSNKADTVPEKPVGSVTLEFGMGGFILSASGGQGVLSFGGRKHPFKLGSLGVGGFGVSKVKATGQVYNLKRVEDFPGAYFQARAGYTALDSGKGVHWLENSNGVRLKLRTTTKGLALQLGADGLMIEMGKIKKSK